jgi:poly [ADP-ribose] polymerase
MLNQTNIGQNNNKYYVIQLLKDTGGSYYVWNRWGRVGEKGQNALKPFGGNINGAINEFKKKFKEKTKNNWENRNAFKPVPGKYTLLDMDYEDDDQAQEEVLTKLADKSAVKGKVKECTLHPAVQKLVKLVFDNDMFKEQLKSFNIDVKKMPLGKISKAQLAKGFAVLEDIEKELKAHRKAKLNELSSKFYTLIPHDFGRTIPPSINELEHLQQKMDLLEVLGDIEIAQGLLKEAESDHEKEIEHPLDINFKKLKNDLGYLEKNTKEYKMIEQYLKSTGPSYRKLELLEAFTLDRHGEKQRFSKNKNLKHRKLLWHGTKVAVMVAILSNGLRIMPHSGGRVGRGLYFASENAKSAGYVGCVGDIGMMLLNEVALGKEYHITRDDSSLRNPPSGYDSVVAQGRTEPDPTKDIKISGDFGDIIVPQGKALDRPEYSGSSFFQSEYLVYDESQVLMKYLLMLRFT